MIFIQFKAKLTGKVKKLWASITSFSDAGLRETIYLNLDFRNVCLISIIFLQAVEAKKFLNFSVDIVVNLECSFNKFGMKQSYIFK